MKTLFLRLLPYMIALSIGIFLFIVTDLFIEHASLNGLLMSIAGGLLSVPIVFICYEVIKQRCDQTLNENLADHLYFELNHGMVELLTCISKLLGLSKITAEELPQYAQMHKSSLKKLMQYRPELSADFFDAKNTIDHIIHNSKHMDILPDGDIRLILSTSKQTGIIARELQYCASEEIKNQLLDSTSILLSYIAQWANAQEENFSNHHSFGLLEKNAASQ